MATRLFGTAKAGSTSVSLDMLLLKFTDGTADTGLLASDLTAYYYRQGAAATTPVTLSDLANLNTVFAAGGVKEIADGSYRVDAPDAAFVTGSDWFEITVKHGSTSLYKERIALEAHGAEDLNTLIGAAGAGLTAASGAIATTLGSPASASVSSDIAAVSATLASYPSLAIPATISSASPTSTQFTVAFGGTISAAMAGSWVGLNCFFSGPGKSPQNLPITSAEFVDTTHATLDFASPGFGVAPAQNDAVEIGGIHG